MYKRAQSTHKLPVHSAKGFANFSASLAMLPPTCHSSAGCYSTLNFPSLNFRQCGVVSWKLLQAILDYYPLIMWQYWHRAYFPATILLHKGHLLRRITRKNHTQQPHSLRKNTLVGTTTAGTRADAFVLDLALLFAALMASIRFSMPGVIGISSIK